MDLPLSRTLRALSDPTRRSILRMLQQGELTAGQIALRLPMTAPSVSHHLSTLKRAGLVRCERRGQTLVYSLDATVLQEALAELVRLFGRDDDVAAHAATRDMLSGEGNAHASA